MKDTKKSVFRLAISARNHFRAVWSNSLCKRCASVCLSPFKWQNGDSNKLRKKSNKPRDTHCSWKVTQKAHPHKDVGTDFLNKATYTPAHTQFNGHPSKEQFQTDDQEKNKEFSTKTHSKKFIVKWWLFDQRYEKRSKHTFAKNPKKTTIMRYITVRIRRMIFN